MTWGDAADAVGSLINASRGCAKDRSSIQVSNLLGARSMTQRSFVKKVVTSLLYIK